MNKFKLVLLLTSLLLSLALVSCSSNHQKASMIPVNSMIERIEVVANEDEIVVSDPTAITGLTEILRRSTRLEQRSDEIEFSGDMKKLRLISCDPEKSRIYRLDSTNGYATIASKAVMPVYKIENIAKFNALLKDANDPTNGG